IMLRAGIPLLTCLEVTKEQTETKKMEKIIHSLADQLNSGTSLSQAMRKYPQVFSPMYANMIGAGEKSGALDSILIRLSKFIGHEIKILDNVKSAMRYPIIVLCALIAAFIVVIVFVIPRFAGLFKSQGLELPLPTRIMIGLSDIIGNYWLLILAVLVLVVGSILFFIRTPKGQWTADFIKLNVPVFKVIFLKSAIARFAHMLETLSRGGIQIVSALETVEKTVGNLCVGRSIAKAREDVSTGVSLASALSKSKYFPVMTLKMISVGEQSGALDDMLNIVASQYDEDVDRLVKNLSAMIEPMVTVIMGVFVLLIALGIFLPMWKMYEAF
ncbi:type II secretion system F family protein, partial [bacterium]|nr:type II secretion system F family protein [bacterium]